MGQFYTSNEIAYVYIITDVDLGEAHRKPTELMEIRLVAVDEALRMAREGEIADGPSARALLWCERLLNSEGFSGDPARQSYTSALATFQG